MAVGDITELLGRTLVIVAHPDDEAVGAGVLLQRMKEACVVFCTDGGPRDAFFWKRYGSREEYVRVRRREAETAAEIAGVKRTEFLSFCDQELHKSLQAGLGELDRVTREVRPSALLTHAYEGGHPDHDCCAFLGRMVARRHNLAIWEMPLYHRNERGLQCQKFVPGAGKSVRVRVKSDELGNKQEMVGAYASQSAALRSFELEVERFRRQPAYDFLRPPADVINYEVWQWPVKAAEVCAAFDAVLVLASVPTQNEQAKAAV